MINYRIQFKASAAKEFRKLPLSIKQRVSATIDNLQRDPRPSGIIKLQGNDQLYRVRVGNYRIVFAIDDNEGMIKITRIRHRQDVYKK